MAIIYEFGTAPQAAKLGYKISHITRGSLDYVASEYFGMDVILVRGARIASGEQGRYEFAVMVPHHLGEVTNMVSATA